jgi:hypothetical protein
MARLSFPTTLIMLVTPAFGSGLPCFAFSLALAQAHIPIGKNTSFTKVHFIIIYISPIITASHLFDHQLAISHNEHLPGCVLYLHPSVLI